MESVQTISAKFLLQGEPDSDSALVHSRDCNSTILSKLAQFASRLQGFLVKKPEEGTKEVWFDLRQAFDGDEQLAKEQAKIILNFIDKFDTFKDKQAKAFRGIEEFNIFKALVQKLKLEGNFELDELRSEVMS